MKTLWFGLGGLAVFCAASLTLNVFLLRDASKQGHRTTAAPPSLEFRSAAGAGGALPGPPAPTAPGGVMASESGAAASSSSDGQGLARSGVLASDGADSGQGDVRPLLVKEVDYSSYDGSINVRFATDGVVDFPLAAKVRLSPAVPDLRLGRGYSGSWELSGSFEPQKTYVLTIRAGVGSSTGEVVRDDLVFNVKVPPLAPQVRFLTSGPYYPSLSGRDGPAARVTLPIGVTNLPKIGVELYRAYANNLGRVDVYFYQWLSHHRKLKAIELAVGGSPTREVQLDLDLTDLLSGVGQGIFCVKLVNPLSDYRHDIAEVIVSDLGLLAAVDQPGRSCQVLVRSLLTGAPVADAEVRVISHKNQPVAEGRTDAAGQVKLAFLPQFDDDEDYPTTVVVAAGGDMSYMRLTGTNRHDLSVFANEGRRLADGPEAFVYTERGVCRPGETMTISVYVRERTGASTAAVAAPCLLSVSDPQGGVLASERLLPDAYGFATTQVKVPASARTGAYAVTCGVDEKTSWGGTTFMVATYVPDRIQVNLEADRTSVAPEDALTCRVSAKYYFGPEVTDGQCDFRVWADLAGFPAHWREYQVGDSAVFVSGRAYTAGNVRLSGTGALVYPGFAAVGGRSYSPVRLFLEATVREPGGRGVTERQTALCHPAPFYLGIRHESDDVVRDGTARLRFRRLVWEAEGEAPRAPLTVSLKLYRVVWDHVRKVNRKGEVRYVWEDVRTAVPGPETVALDGDDGEVVLTGLADGRYELIAEAGTGVRTRLAFWHWQGEGGSRSANPNVLTLVTDRPQYAPGDTAEVTVTSPGAGYVHIAAGEHRLEQGFSQVVSQGVNRFRVAIPADVSTGHYAAGVTLVCPGRSATRQFGLLRLPVDQGVHRLGIEMSLPERAVPGEEVRVAVKLTGADGRPCGGQVQVFAVDEGILALTDYATPDIFAFFHSPRFCSFEFYDLYSALFPDIRIGTEGRIGGDGVEPRQLRQRLGEIKSEAPAVWVGPALAVPATGEAVQPVRLPEHVGALRVMAVGVSETSVGSAARELLMRNVISVLATAPRSVAPGDEWLMTVTAFNHDLDEGEAELEIQLPPGLASTAASRHALVLPRGGSRTISVPCVAAGGVGFREVVCLLKLGSASHRRVFPITVRSPIPPVTEAVTLEVPAGEIRRLQADGAEWLKPPTAKLRVSASPVLGVKDAMDWLNGYPYGCLEQTTAAAFPFLGVDNLLKAGLLSPGMVPAVRSKAEMAQGGILAMMQADGSFAMWPGSHHQRREASVFAAHFLVAAEQTLGRPLDVGTRYRLQQSLWRLADDASAGRWLRAYSAYVLSLGSFRGFLPPARNLLLEQKSDLPSFLAAAALIRGGYAAEGAVPLRRLLAQEVWRDEREAAGYMRDGASRLGMVLSILMDVMPEHEAALRLAGALQSLLREDGSGWGTTHANAWVAYGLSAFAARQKTGQAQGSISVKGGIEAPINTDRIQEFDLGESQEVALMNTGTAPYYVRLLRTGIPQRLSERREVLDIKREYLTAEGRAVTRVEHGRLLTVKLTVTAAGQISDLALIDLLPGGLEIEDEMLATRAYAVPAQSRGEQATLRPIFIEKRDDRFLFFGDIVTGGTSTITYQVRAVTRGKFTLPPVRMEGMYDPEVQGTHVPAGRLEVY